MTRTAVEKYATNAKGEYRESLWTTLAPPNVPPGPVLILTGPEGLEIPVLRRFGFHDDEMHLVDKIAAYPIMSKQKHGADAATNYYGDLTKSIDTMRQRGVKIAYANVDLCCTVMNALPVVHKVMTTAEVFSGCRVAFTWQKARDNLFTGFLMRKFKVATRVGLVNRIIRDEWPNACFLGEGEYNNGTGGKGNMPMQWGAWELKV